MFDRSGWRGEAFSPIRTGSYPFLDYRSPIRCSTASTLWRRPARSKSGECRFSYSTLSSFVFEAVLDGYCRVSVFTSPLIRPHERGTPGYFLAKSCVDSLSDNKGFANDEFGAVPWPPVCQSAVIVLLYSQLKREHSWPLKCMQ